MEVRQNDDVFREKEWFRAKIGEMLDEIDRADILEYIWIIISDILKERTARVDEQN